MGQVVTPAYYNDNDPHAAAWLRRLIQRGALPRGFVDDRDVAQVDPDHLAAFGQCHFFAGIGGWPHALRVAGWPDDLPVWTASLPCQPFSVIGKRKGTEDDRHLWPTFARLVRAVRPVWIFGEQVSSEDGRAWIDGVFDDLEGMGYACAALDLCAAGVGAPHRRQRLYWMGNACGAGLEGLDRHGIAAGQTAPPGSRAPTGSIGTCGAGLDAVSLLRRLALHDSRVARRRLSMSADRPMAGRSVWTEFDALPCVDGWRRVRPGAFPLAAGISGRVGRLRGYGNSIVPHLAAAFIRAAVETVAETKTASGFLVPTPPAVSADTSAASTAPQP